MAKTTITMGREGDEHESELEPLIVLAIADNKLYHIAISELYPNDIIYYSIDKWYCDWTNPIPDAKGVIYRRIDTLNNLDIPFDFRNIYFRRWKIDLANIKQYSTSMDGFKAFELMKVGLLHCVTFTSSDTEYGALTSSCLYASMPVTDLYLSCDSDRFHMDAHMGKYGSAWGMSNGFKVDATDYKDYRVFQLETNHIYRDTVIRSNGTSSSMTLPNIVFKQSSRRNDITYAANGTICGNAYDNNIGRIHDSLILGDFNSNSIHAAIKDVLVFGNFVDNHISCNIMQACIFKSFVSNHINVDMLYMYSGKSFAYNHVSADKVERNYCTMFEHNNLSGETISHNTFCATFHYNKIDRYCDNNKFGTSSIDKIDYSNFSYVDGMTYGTTSFNNCENNIGYDLSLYSENINAGDGVLWHIFPSKTCENLIAERTNADGTKEQLIIV